MDQQLSVIRENLATAISSRKVSDAVVFAQYEELVHVLSDTKLSFAEAYELYCSVFSFSLLSREFFNYCISLAMYGILTDDVPNTSLEIGTTSLLFNAYSEKALERFSDYIGNDFEQESDFTSVCESVYSKRCKYALVPLYNTRDGLIISLYKLIQRYDLHLCSSTRVLMGDGNTETDFFLVTNQPVLISENENRIFLSLTHSADMTLSALVSAVCSCGVVLKYINTLPIEYTDDRNESVILLEVADVPLTAVRCFIEYALPNASVLGIYSIVK